MSGEAGAPHRLCVLRIRSATASAVMPKLRAGELVGGRGPDGIFVGMRGFGASAPYKDLYRHFGITAEAVAERILRTHNL